MLVALFYASGLHLHAQRLKTDFSLPDEVVIGHMPHALIMVV